MHTMPLSKLTLGFACRAAWVLLLSLTKLMQITANAEPSPDCQAKCLAFALPSVAFSTQTVYPLSLQVGLEQSSVRMRLLWHKLQRAIKVVT